MGSACRPHRSISAHRAPLWLSFLRQYTKRASPRRHRVLRGGGSSVDVRTRPTRSDGV